jgi:hypothetical protein
MSLITSAGGGKGRKPEFRGTLETTTRPEEKLGKNATYPRTPGRSGGSAGNRDGQKAAEKGAVPRWAENHLLFPTIVFNMVGLSG